MWIHEKTGRPAWLISQDQEGDVVYSLDPPGERQRNHTGATAHAFFSAHREATPDELGAVGTPSKAAKSKAAKPSKSAKSAAPPKPAAHRKPARGPKAARRKAPAGHEPNPAGSGDKPPAEKSAGGEGAKEA